jgi:YggT family protein
MNPIELVITTIAQFLSILIIANSLLSFVLTPYHPIREALGRILEPIYAPLRRIVPQAGGLDFTPLAALVLIQVIVMILTSIF